MRKAYALLLSLALVISLAGCGGGPEGSDKAIATGKQVVEVVDQYLDREISYDDADEKLDELYGEMEYTKDLDFSDPDVAIKYAIISIDFCVMDDHFDQTTESYDELVASRDKLAELVGMKKR